MTGTAATHGAVRSSADEIRDLIHRYSWLVDQAEFDEMAALFEHAVTSNGKDSSIEMGSPAELAAMYRGNHRLYDVDVGVAEREGPARRPLCRHLCTNVIIDIDDGHPSGERATARSKYVVQQAVAETGFALQAIVAGRYHDTFERVDGRWRFVERVFFVDLVGDLSAHHLSAAH